MVKSNVTLSIDTEVLQAARKFGCNMSDICETALAMFTGYQIEKPTLKELMEDENKQSFREKLIKAVSRNPVQFAKSYARMIHVHYGYKYTPNEITTYVEREASHGS